MITLADFKLRLMWASLCLILVITACSAPTAAPTQVPATPTAKPSLFPRGTEGFPWWNDSVYYEIFVRSFYDSNGDGIGDFNGITAKLDYLNDGNPQTTTDLGITGLWLMPIHPSPSYHGYDVVDYYDVNPEYGTMDEFKRLLSEAHKRGIRVNIDFVINHTSSEHPWFIASKDPTSNKRDWYVWAEAPGEYLGPWGQKVWYPALGGGYYYAVFWDQMPDLNHNNPQVVEEVKKVARFWLDLGVDGFRVDGARHLIEEGENQADTASTHAWFKQFRPFYKSVNPQAMVVAEVWTSSFAVVKYIKGDEVDLAFDFDLASAWVSGVMNRDGRKLRSITTSETSTFENQQVAIFLTNHDINRIMSQLGRDFDKAKAAATLLLTSPGVPFIYYGEEIGMTGIKPDEKIRTPMQWDSTEKAGFTTGSPWISLNDNIETVNVAVQDKDPASLLAHYRALIQARNRHAALRIGKYIKVDPNNDSIYAAVRQSANETVVVLINLEKTEISDYALDFTLTGLKGNFTVEALLGEGSFAPLSIPEDGTVSGYQPLPDLPANTSLVLLLKKTP